MLVFLLTEVEPSVAGTYCYCPITHKVTLGEIVSLLHEFADQPSTLMRPEIPAGSFAKKLYSTFLSYLPESKVAFLLKMNISKPGITKGQHWHHSKWEFFIVVAGRALIQERRVDSDEVLEFTVSGDAPTAVQMLPGYTHNIINLSDTEDLITLMWANEPFDPAHPDTFGLKV